MFKWWPLRLINQFNLAVLSQERSAWWRACMHLPAGVKEGGAEVGTMDACGGSTRSPSERGGNVLWL